MHPACVCVLARPSALVPSVPAVTTIADAPGAMPALCNGSRAAGFPLTSRCRRPSIILESAYRFVRADLDQVGPLVIPRQVATC